MIMSSTSRAYAHSW